jgi:hypothetical protein
MKSQITTAKSQTNLNSEMTKRAVAESVFGLFELFEFGASLEFVICDLGFPS